MSDNSLRRNFKVGDKVRVSAAGIDLLTWLRKRGMELDDMAEAVGTVLESTFSTGEDIVLVQFDDERFDRMIMLEGELTAIEEDKDKEDEES